MRFKRGLALSFAIFLVITGIIPVVSCGVSISKNLLLEEVNGVTIGRMDTDVFLIPDSPPDKPDRPSGPTEGKIGTEYTYYTTNPVNPSGDITYYKWDWGDGSFTDWVPYGSGEIVTSLHIWSEKGSYDVRIKAKNDFGESPWSDPLTVTIIEKDNSIRLNIFHKSIFNNLFSILNILRLFL